MKVSCLGPEGSYSLLAAKELCPDEDIILCHDFLSAVNALIEGESDAVVLPIENSIQGGVLQNLDLLKRARDLYAVKEKVLKIEHRLVIKDGTDLSDVNTVFSHPQALAQCSRYLDEFFPDAKRIPVNSTAESLDMIKNGECAGIVGAHISREGFTVLERNIANESANFTHFLLVKRGAENISERTSKIFYMATCKHRPGALLKLLQVMYVYDLNMTKIESRPIKEIPGEYSFFIEAEGDIGEYKIKKALEDIKKECIFFKLLGAY